MDKSVTPGSYIGGPVLPSHPEHSASADFGDFARESFGRPILYLGRFYQAYLDTNVAQYGISSAHVPMLAFLWEGHNAVTQNEIARNIAVDKGTVSRNVQTLVRLGLITQNQSPYDSRACIIELTQAGWDLMGPVTTVLRGWTEFVAGDMDESEREAVLHGLHSVTKRAQELLARTRGIQGDGAGVSWLNTQAPQSDQVVVPAAAAAAEDA